MRCWLMLLLLVGGAAQAQTPTLLVYGDALSVGFQDWSWGTHAMANPTPTHGGSASISFAPASWGGLLFANPDTHYDAAAYQSLTLWIHGGSSGGQILRLTLLDDTSARVELDVAPLVTGGGIAAGTWRQLTLPFTADNGLTSGGFNRVQIMDFTGGSQGTVYIDDIQFNPRTEPLPAGNQTVSINLGANRRTINPEIYGVNFGSDAQHADLRYPVRRNGGNSVTRYNWQLDTHSTASDWFYQNIPDGNGVGMPNQSTAMQFIDSTRQYGGQPLMTLSTIGWTPKDRVKRWGFSIVKYGAQLNDECRQAGFPSWCTADAGSGTCNPSVNTTGFCFANPSGNPLGYIRNNDPLDTSMAVNPAFAAQYVAQIITHVGANAGNGGVRYYALDNEPMLWNSTHRDVHPAPATYDEIWSKTVAYGTAIKAQDPAAQIFGPVTWGWCDLFTSASDAAAGPTCINGADRQAHGGMPFAEWYLKQVCDYQAANGVRLVDYLDVHYYPQGDVNNVHDLAGTDPARVDETTLTSAWRLRSLKELYDPAYTQESWIADQPRLIPRLKSWIAARCPAVKLAITEYKWGPDNGASGALAQAEALAIFGREGVDQAQRWIAPADGSYAEDAFRMYLDYDGANSRVVGDSVAASSTDVDALGAYAVHKVGQHVYVLLFNKSTSPQNVTINLSSALSGAWQWHRFDGSNHLAVVGSGNIAGSSITLNAIPARSSSLLVLPDADSIFKNGFEAP